MKAIINARIYDYLSYIENGYIIYGDKIEEVGYMKDFAGCEEVLDAKGALVLPGLVNFHTHIYSQLFRGMSLDASPSTFLELLEQVWWKFDSKLSIEDIRQSAESFCEESLLNGVTSIIDHHASGVIEGTLAAIANAADGYGMKGLYCFETSDRFDVQECIKENLSEGSAFFGLHASMSLSDETLRKVSWATDRPMHVHVAESRQDENLSVKLSGQRVVERMDAYGLLRRNSLLAHCVHVDSHEAMIIGNRGCAVVLNPSSNANNSVGLFNYRLLYGAGARILAGTDGLGSNVAREWLNIYFQARQSAGMNSGITPENIRRHIVEGYEYFSEMSKTRTGQLAKGFEADMMVVEYRNPTPMNRVNIFGHVLFGLFDSLRPRHVIAAGKHAVWDYSLARKSNFDMDSVNKLWERVGE